MKALLVTPDNKVEVIDRNWNYLSIQEAVGGLIQPVYFGEKDCSAYVNEEGKIFGLPENYLATEYWYNSGETVLLGDYLVGNALFFGMVDFEGNETEVPQHVIDYFFKEAGKQ